MSITTNRANQPAHIERYYDYHPVEGEEMGQNDFHHAAANYLVTLLKWLYRGQQVYVAGELNLYRTAARKEIPVTPDIVLIKGIAPLEERTKELSSYYIGVDGPPPAVVIEVSSPGTWRDDLGPKVAWYGEAGIAEYFAYDPHSTPLWTKEWRKYGRLAGWELDATDVALQELPKLEVGQYWSKQLNSRLVIEGRELKLYDRAGQLRLSEAEEATAQAQAERVEKLRERARANAERVEKLREQARAEAERMRADVAQAERVREQTRAEAERARAEAERARAEKLAEFLRQHNFDPDKLV